MKTRSLCCCILLAAAALLISAADPNSRQSPPPEIKLPDRKPGERIQAAAALSPSRLAPGESAEIFLKVRLAPGHHIYALGKSGSDLKPTAITVELPPNLSLAGDWKAPEPSALDDGSRVHKGEVIFRNRLTAGAGLPPGRLKIPVTLKYQVCNDLLCWPPEEILNAVELEVVREQ